ncbi:DUF6207 family protein [Streptomyces fagopyri]
MPVDDHRIYDLLTGRCAAARADRVTKIPGESGVWLRFFVDLRERPNV